VVGSNGVINPAYAGAALNQILSLGGFLGFAVNTFTMLESSMVCVERIEEYSNNIGREPEWELETDKQLAADWPSEGRIEFHEVTMRYRDALDPALRSATAMVQAHEKLGVAGRTGSGKSSLMLTLFRLYPLSAETDKDSVGKIVIDGVDISVLAFFLL
jgi:ABC-type multidrug transport system fused ATPase/permease subunit